jgi:hypothetical protein
MLDVSVEAKSVNRTLNRYRRQPPAPQAELDCPHRRARGCDRSFRQRTLLPLDDCLYALL